MQCLRRLPGSVTRFAGVQLAPVIRSSDPYGCSTSRERPECVTTIRPRAPAMEGDQQVALADAPADTLQLEAQAGVLVGCSVINGQYLERLQEGVDLAASEIAVEPQPLGSPGSAFSTSLHPLAPLAHGRAVRARGTAAKFVRRSRPSEV